jgi:adenylyltransferase/sulfurtransferase
LEGYFRRQIQLSEIGEVGQQKLLTSKVLVVGAGGLGCPVLSVLASCGIGHITVIDFDTIEQSNLHRQPLYGMQDIGKSKSEVAEQFLSERYSHCHIHPVNGMFDAKMAVQMVPEFDVLVDCTDNLPVRYLLDDAARLFGKPWVHASVSKFNLQWALFRPALGYAYRNVYPVPPNPIFMGQCNTEGVLGAVPSLAGTLQANIVLNVLLGLDNTDGKLFHMDTRNGSSYAITYAPVLVTEPATADELINYNYERFCQNFNP